MHPISAALASGLIALSALAMTGSALAADMPSTPPSMSSAPDVKAELAAARRDIQQENWPAAVRELEKAVRKDNKQAEVHTLLGFALRKSGQLDRAFASYDTALKLDPRNVGAHEYVGEAYLIARKPEKAREHLATLKGLCGEGCEQYQDLSKAIAAYKP